MPTEKIITVIVWGTIILVAYEALKAIGAVNATTAGSATGSIFNTLFAGSPAAIAGAAGAAVANADLANLTESGDVDAWDLKNLTYWTALDL